MNRSKKWKHKNRTKAEKERFYQRQDKIDGPVFVRHPFSGIPPDVLRNHAIQYARESEQTFNKYISEIMKILREVDPLSLISQLAMYGLTCGLSDDGTISEWNSKKGFSQANVELVQALSLRLMFNEIGSAVVNPDVLQCCFDDLPKLSEAFAARRMADLEKELSEQQKSIYRLQEHLRLHTQTVRNWGYIDRVIRILNSLTAYFDEEFFCHFGISATDIFKIFNYLLKRTEINGNIRFKKMKHVFSQQTVDEMISTYINLFECDKNMEAIFIDELKQYNLTTENVKVMLMMHRDLACRDMYTFSSYEVAKDLNIPVENVKFVFQQISINFGDLSDKQPASFLLDNPIWTKPIIKLKEEIYFCALPMVLFGFSFYILNNIVALNQKVKIAYHEGRSRFLEEEIAKLFKNALPGSKVCMSYKWHDGSVVFENDLLVCIDSIIFVVEAKSHTVSWPALRGAPDRARKHFQETILDPSEQSWRLSDRLRQVLENPELLERLLPHFPLSLDGVHTVLRLSVTLEDFAVVQTKQCLIRGTGWIPKAHRLAPCILLADLEIVFDMLDSVSQRIHYLRRRAEIADNMYIEGDEIDFIGLYINTGFNIGTAEFDENALVITGMSEIVDEYYVARAENILRNKPVLKLTRWWRAIIDAIEEKRFNGWIEIICIMLNCSYEDQQRAEIMFDKLRKDIHNTYTNPEHLSSVIIIPNEHRSDSLVFYGFKEIEKNFRHDVMHELSCSTFDKEHIKRCLVIGINIDRPTHPYSTLACFSRNHQTYFDVK